MDLLNVGVGITALVTGATPLIGRRSCVSIRAETTATAEDIRRRLGEIRCSTIVNHVIDNEVLPVTGGGTCKCVA
jgi:hypothetical protein